MANIGDQLLKPEEGWKRIDDQVIKKYATYDDSQWMSYTGSYPGYNGTAIKCNSKYSSFIFGLYSSKIRLITFTDTNRTTNAKIKIDDNSYTINMQGSRIQQVLIFNKENIEKKLHKITFVSGTGGEPFILDAIDIDEDGYLLTENQYEAYTNSNFIKTSNNIKSDTDYSLDADLLELRDNYHGIKISELSNMIKDIKEDYRIIKIKK